MHHSMLRDGTFGKSCGSLYQCLDGIDFATDLIHARTEHGTTNLNHVLIAVQGGVNADAVLIHQLERAHVEFANAEYGVACTCLTIHADGFGIGVASETASIAQKGSGTLGLLHLVEHGALHLTRDIHQSLVGTDGDDVIVLQTYIARELAVQQEVVDIDIRQQLAITVNLDITQCTYIVRTACHIQGIIDGGKGRHRIGARHFDLTHDADGDGTSLSQCQFNLRTLIAGT